MPGILTTPTPDQTRRFADALDESWRVIARHDPEFAAVQRYYAIAIRKGEIIAPPLVPPPSQASTSRPARLSKHKQVQLARTWFLNRQEQFEGKTPPSEARDIEDARDQIPGVSRAVIRKHRPIEWRVGRDKKPKSPNS